MSDEPTTIVALLHDVVEDSDYTIDDVKAMGFSDEVVEVTNKKKICFILKEQIILNLP